MGPSRARPIRRVSLDQPNRWVPKKFGKPRSATRRAVPARSARQAGSASRNRMLKRFPHRCPVRSLLPWRTTFRMWMSANWRTQGRRSSHSSGTDSHWRVTARRSFVPAAPMSWGAMANSAASRFNRSPPATSRFSTHRNRWPPCPQGVYTGISSTSKSSGIAFRRAATRGRSGKARGSRSRSVAAYIGSTLITRHLRGPRRAPP